MSDLDQLRRPENLQRAWRWIRSNPDAAYKSYFRPLYQRFAIAEDALIDDLSERLRRGIYEPEPACKCFHPKSSGILRPLSLLSVEDQIVYQAAVNLIAEKLQPRVVQRYNKQVFGHLYAGKTATWFYRKWSDGYKAFNEAARTAFADGYIETASFDLTACYDSLDHGVLRHFLEKLGLDPEFCRKVTEWLEKWTATDRKIFHNHGIPQGPLSSGLLSEVVLSHFDELKVTGVDFRFFRYVDDIRLFAKKERDLRRLLVSLDLLSKDVGLFPQSGKISIHRVTDIEKEIKTVSNPPETAISFLSIDQAKVLKRIKELTPRYEITNTTRFKYLLAHASPSAELTARLWEILERNPELYRSFCSYLRRYPKLPRVAAEKVVEQIKTNILYQAVRAAFIDVADGRLPTNTEQALVTLLKPAWTPKAMDAELQIAIGRFLIRTGGLSPNQIRYACRVAPSWWARAMLIDAITTTALGSTTIHQIVDSGVVDQSRDASMAAAWKGTVISHVPPGTRRNWNKAAELLLKEVGQISRSTAVYCGVSHAFRKLDRRIPSFNWQGLFGSRHRQAERQAIEVVAASGTNITNFVNLLDVFNDLLLDSVFRSNGSIGNYTLGRIGSALSSNTCRFATTFPKTFALANEVHELRYVSMASHPLIRNSGKPTKRINYSFLSKAKRLLIESITELGNSGII